MSAILDFQQDFVAPLAPVFIIGAEADHHISEREALLDRAMGEGRRRKSSEKLRRGRLPAAGLALVAEDAEGNLIGTVRLWDIAVGEGVTGLPVKALLLGPLAVDPSMNGCGVGSALMRRAIQDARGLGHKAILLVGDPEFYGRFGFRSGITANLAMPGPFEKRRLLALELQDGYLEKCRGVIQPCGVFQKSRSRKLL